VQYVPYSMARMPFIWGSDALELKPERWLKDGVFQSVSPFKFTTFQVLNPILLFIATFQNLQTWGADAAPDCMCVRKSPRIEVHFGASDLFGPRLCFLAVEGYPVTHHSLLHLPVGAWTRINLHFRLGHAHEERCTSHYLPSAEVIRGWSNNIDAQPLRCNYRVLRRVGSEFCT
jgi:hypothetical protein